MNKLFTKAAKLVLGLSLAAGVGAAVGSQKANRVDAAYEVIATFDFSSTAPSGSTSTALTDSTLLDTLNDSSSVSSLVSSASKSGDVYIGKGSGGSGIPQATLKIGKAGGGGSITFTIGGSDNVSKVVINGYSWKTTSSISVNSETAQTYGTAASLHAFEFELGTATKTITITTTTSCVCASTIVLYKTTSSCTHNWVAGTVHPATCTEAGYTEYECSLCGATKQDDVVAALGHSYGDWTVTTAATCTEAGEKTRVCSRDPSHVETEVIAALGHTYSNGVCEVCGALEPQSYSHTFTYSEKGTGSGKTWDVTNAEDSTDYWKVPSSGTSVATFPGIFTGKTITSNVVITLNIATFGSGDNPSSSKFTIYNSSACTNQIAATQSGSLPTSSTYVNAIYTVTQANAEAGFADDLAIKVSSGGKQIRLKSITVAFDYSLGTSPSIVLSSSIIEGYTGQGFSVTATFANLTGAFYWGTPSVANKITGSVTATSGTSTDGTSTYSGTLDAEGSLTLSASGGGAETQTVSFDITKTAFTTTPASTGSVGVGKTLSLTAVLNSGGTINWTSDDDSVATVSSAGVVTGVAAGSTTITATSADDSTVSAECDVEVILLKEASHTYASSDGLTVNLQDNGVTIAKATMAKLAGSSYSTPAWNETASEYRLYGSSSITIVPEMNYDLTWFEAVFTSNENKDGYTPSITYSIDGGTSHTFASGTIYECSAPSSIVITTSASAGNKGFTSIYVGYQNSATTVELESISSSGTLLKSTQYVGQPFDSVGLTFTGHYDNGSSATIASSDIEWNTLAIGSSVTGSYLGVSVTVTGLTILNTSDAEEIIFFNSLSSDANNYSELASHSKLGDVTFATGSHISNGMDSSIKGEASEEGGSFTMTNNVTGKYISQVIFIAKTYGTDTTSLNVSGTSTDDDFALTSSWASYSLDVSDDEGSVVTFSTTGSKQRFYIHSVTLILESEDKTAVTFANKILNELTCTASGNTAPSTSEWNALKTYYNTGSNVSSDSKTLLQTTSAPYETWKDFVVSSGSSESERICAALAKYDYVIAKYGALEDGNGNKVYENFIQRSVTPLSGGARLLDTFFGNNNTSTVAIIVVISMVSVTAIGGYFFLKKRREQN